MATHHDKGTDLDQNIESNGESLNILTLPSELLVYILSFLTNVRDIVKLRYVSRRLRSVCETPSLWREFVWPHLDICEVRCVKSVLKSCGQHVKRLCFPGHVMPPKQLMAVLQHCSNLVELCIPTCKLNHDKLKKMMESTEKLWSLDVPWIGAIQPALLVICSRLKELTVRIDVKWKISSFQLVLGSWLDEWAMKEFLPNTLKIAAGQNIPLIRLLENWFRLNPHLPTGHTGCLKMFSTLKVPMNLFPVLPDFQLQFGQSCTLPFVKPRKCGLLGLEEDHYILLTDSTYGDKAVHKARIVTLSDDILRGHLNSDTICLDFVKHFDVSGCRLYSGHLEQLAIACPNLQQLNLLGVSDCLKRLQGLNAIFTCCKQLQGLNIVNVTEVESHVRLWKILADMRLTYLAVNICTLIPLEEDKPEIVSSFQECVNLKALEVHHSYCYHDEHKNYDLSVLSNFSSLLHCFIGDIHNNIEVVINSCSKLKYLVHSSLSSHFSYKVSTQNENLEQLCIKSALPRYVEIPNTFMQSVSAHGGLVHVALCTGIVYGDGVTALIGNSPKLLTCHLFSRNFCIKVSDKYESVMVRDMKMMLKKKFGSRKLFTCGSFQLYRSDKDAFHNIDHFLVERDTDILSLWSTRVSGTFFHKVKYT